MTSIVSIIFLFTSLIASVSLGMESSGLDFRRASQASSEMAVNLPIEEEVQKVSKKEKLIKWLHSRNSPGHFGDEEPDLPTLISFKPRLVPLPADYRLPPDFIVVNDKLDLEIGDTTSIEAIAP